MICSGVTGLILNIAIGDIAIVDVNTMIPLSDMSVTPQSSLVTAIAEKPFDVGVVDTNLRLYFAPDQHNTIVYPILNSPGKYWARRKILN